MDIYTKMIISIIAISLTLVGVNIALFVFLWFNDQKNKVALHYQPRISSWDMNVLPQLQEECKLTKKQLKKKKKGGDA